MMCFATHACIGLLITLYCVRLVYRRLERVCQSAVRQAVHFSVCKQ